MGFMGAILTFFLTVQHKHSDIEVIIPERKTPGVLSQIVRYRVKELV
jgi:hypothetical protein